MSFFSRPLIQTSPLPGTTAEHTHGGDRGGGEQHQDGAAAAAQRIPKEKVAVHESCRSREAALETVPPRRPSNGLQKGETNH